MSAANLSFFAKASARVKALYPAVAFFGGFILDVATMGQNVSDLDLFVLLFYLTASGGILVWMGRRGSLRPDMEEEDAPGGAEDHGASAAPGVSAAPNAATQASGSFAADYGETRASGHEESGSEDNGESLSRFGKIKHWLREEGPIFALQFMFGSMFSALFIFYFLSSSYWPGFLVTLVLLCLLIGNEFIEKHYHRFTLTWTLYGMCAILYTNFALPHLFRSIHPVWFYVSTALGAGLVYGLKRLSPKAQGSLKPIYAIAVILVALFLCNAIPPVPLVKKSMVICRNLVKAEGGYEAEMEQPPFYDFWRKSESLVRHRPDEKVYCFTSIFLPTGIQCTLYHRWRYDDPRKHEWVEQSRIGFPIRGGRHDGFRGFTYKRTLPDGRWEVRVETETGRVLGTVHFRVEATADTSMQFKKLILR